MDDFRIDEQAIHGIIRRAGARPAGDLEMILERAAAGLGLPVDDMAALWGAESVSTETLYQAARGARKRLGTHLETFSPLYMTNTCDAECRMCGMRRDNTLLVRQTATLDELREQLSVLHQRGVWGVALLSGEYHAATRPWAIEYANAALRAALDQGFRHILINIGSIDDDEFQTLLTGIPRDADGALQPKVTMCTFQETYSRPIYAKFMGTDPDNPRADFDRRAANFDRAFRAGMRVANPGILVGLNADLAYEGVALALHATHLVARGMEVYLSIPRLRQIAGRHTQRGASDDDFVRLVAILSLALPTCKPVITTREPAAVQHQLAPIANVISAGSSAVAPYTATGARFPLEASQFEVIDQRPFEEILREHLAHSDRIENFHPKP